MPQNPQLAPRAYLRRYIHFPAAIQMLITKSLTLRDSSTWDGSNDKFYIAGGEVKVLFLPDDTNHKSDYDSKKINRRLGGTARIQELIKFQEIAEAANPVHRMTSEESWRIMQTYEQWLRNMG